MVINCILFMTKNKTVELSRIDSSEYMQGVTGRLFNFGTVEIFPLDGEHIYRKNIESPIELINTLNATKTEILYCALLLVPSLMLKIIVWSMNHVQM